MRHFDKTVHMIWVGPQVPMDDLKLETTLKWCSNNPDYTIKLWVDTLSAQRTLSSIKEKYRSKASSLPNNLSFHDISELPAIADPSYRAKIQQGLSCVRFEIDRLEPNYGAASDLSRYMILYLHGGCYFDIDIDPAGTTGKKNVLDPLLEKIKRLLTTVPHIFVIDAFSQVKNDALTPTLKEKTTAIESWYKPTAKGSLKTQKERFLRDHERVSNDTLGCTQYNPIMKKLLENVIENYHSHLASIARRKGLTQLNTQIAYAYGSNDRMLYTIPMTGPDVLRDTLFHATQDSTGSVGTVTTFRNADFVVIAPQTNALSWCRIRTRNLNDKEASIVATLGCAYTQLCFEAHHFGILRIDDIINYVRNAVTIPEEALESVVNKLFMMARDILRAYHAKGISLVVQNTRIFSGKHATYLALAKPPTRSHFFTGETPPPLNLNDPTFVESLNYLLMQAEFAQDRFQLTAKTAESLIETYLERITVGLNIAQQLLQQAEHLLPDPVFSKLQAFKKNLLNTDRSLQAAVDGRYVDAALLSRYDALKHNVIDLLSNALLKKTALLNARSKNQTEGILDDLSLGTDLFSLDSSAALSQSNSASSSQYSRAFTSDTEESTLQVTP